MAELKDSLVLPNGALQAILYTPAKSSPTSIPTLQVLDQLALPHQTIYIPIKNSQDAYNAIKSMSVRGAPAIAIVAALSVAVEISSLESSSSSKAVSADGMNGVLIHLLEYLLDSRPTAVNLRDAVTKLLKISKTAAQIEGATAESVRAAYIEAAEKMLVDDVDDNQAIGQFGTNWIKKNLIVGNSNGKVAVLTHCNTGFVFLSFCYYYHNC